MSETPRVPSNPPPKPYIPQDLKLDPPPSDGPKVGDQVYCWQGDQEPLDPLKVCAGFVTQLGHNGRIAVSLMPKDYVSFVVHDAVIPHDDSTMKGKLPNSWRWKPSPSLATLRSLEEKVEALTRQLEELKVSLKAKPPQPVKPS